MIENGYLSAKQYFKGQMLIPGEYIFLQTQVVNATSQQSSAWEQASSYADFISSR